MMDFKGDWKTEGGFRAEVRKVFLGYWVGILKLEEGEVPTFWNKAGNSTNPIFNLKERRREEIRWD